MKVLVSLDKEKFKHKPSQSQYKDFTDKRGRPLSELIIIGSRVGGRVKELTIPELANAICSGQTWSPFTFHECPRTGKVRRRIELFKQCQVLALDFDNGITYDQILANCAAHGLTPSIIHESFSSTEELRKYRLVFALDKVYSEARTVRLMIHTLLSWFPDADKSAKDLARIMFGTDKKPLLVNPSAVNTIIIDPEVEAKSEEKNLIYYEGDSTEGIEHLMKTYEDFKKDFPRLRPNQKAYIKKSVSEAVAEIRNLGYEGCPSRYETVFSNAEKLTGIKGLYSEVILYYLVAAVKSNPYFHNWEYNPYEVVSSAISWKSQTPNVRNGDLFDIDEYYLRKEQEKLHA